MRPTSRFLLASAAATAVALAVVAVPIALRGDNDAPVEPTPEPGLRAKIGEIRTSPVVPGPLRKAVTSDIAETLRVMYERAFVQPQATPGPDTTPRPRPATRVKPSFSHIARRALSKSPEVFDEAADLSVYSGTVAFSGLLTFEGKVPVEALLTIDFTGDAAPVGSGSPQVDLHQVGTLLLKHTAEGWFVDGFDLRFRTRPAPTPTPSPR